MAPRDTAVRTNLPQPSSQQLLIYFAYEVWGRTWRGPRPSESATPPRRAQRYWQQPASDSFGKVDRKSTRLKLQSLMRISYAVFCLKKKTIHTGRNLY